MASLPTAEQIQNAVNDEMFCRGLLLQVLSFGTDYDVWPKKEGLAERSQEAASVLVQAWSSTPQLQSLLVDTLWLVGSLAQNKDALIHILKSLVLKVPDRHAFYVDLQATLDPSLLEAVQLLPKGGKEALLKKVRKFNTETYYRQQKFNLFHEESEGYAKLLTLLLSISSSSASPSSPTDRILDLIGTFELDPNRVLDLLLDMLESHLLPIVFATEKPSIPEAARTILQVIKDFALDDKIPPLIGFKIASYQEIPKSLFVLMGLLATEGHLNVTALMPHLSSVSEIDAAHQIYVKCERQRIQAMGKIRLNMDANKEDPKLVENAKKLQEATTALEKSTLIGLVQVLLQWKEWDLAKQLLPSWTKICSLLPDSVGDALCRLVHTQIQNTYHVHVHTPVLRLLSSDAVTMTESSMLTLEEILQSIAEPLSATMDSACIQTHPILYCQLCRLLKALLESESHAESVSATVYSLLRLLVSSLSLFPPNPAISADLWSVLSILPYPTRYRLYKDWAGGGLERAGLLSKPLIHVKCEIEAGTAARYALKRLSKDNVRDMGRQVSKVTHSNPLVVFSTILNQIESYDNLIEMMVESVRFVTPLSLDVLGYCILSRLSDTSDSGSRARVKDDGVNVSQWLASLESFTGAFYKRCPDVECRGVLWYVVRRLKDGQVLELGVLRTLLKTAGGYAFADYSPVSSLSSVQLEGRAGSQLLKRETFAFGVVEHFNKRSSRRLRSILQSDNMGVAMLILLAQIRSKLVYDTSDKRPKHVKLIGNLYDMCQVVMGMLLEFLTDTSDEDQAADGGNGFIRATTHYAASLPSLGELCTKYGLDPASAWMLYRPLCSAAIPEEGESKATSGNGQDNSEKAFLPDDPSKRKSCREMLPESAWTDISTDLFEFFYSHTLYDLWCPESCYDAEITRLKKDEERLIQRQKGNTGTMQLAQGFSKADELELERLRAKVTALTADLAGQRQHCEISHQQLQAKKSMWFPSQEISAKSAQSFLVHCVYPRCMSSPDDALYCAHFVSHLHQQETPGFSILHYFDELMSVVTGALYCITEGEAATLAILLLATLKVLARWRYDEVAFGNELAGKPGSCMEKSPNGGCMPVSHEEYCVLYNKWHATLGAAAMGCLKSSEYMHTRACLVVLTRIVDVFPTRPGLGQLLISALVPLQDEGYPMQDIKTTAHAYGMLIAKARDEGVWKEEDAAVAEARRQKEKTAVAEKKEKFRQQFEEMERESKKITEELGESGPRRRDERRQGQPRGGGDTRSAKPDSRPPLMNSRPVASEADNGDSGRDNAGRKRSPPAPINAIDNARPARGEGRDGDEKRGREGDQRVPSTRSGDSSRRSSRERENLNPPQGTDSRDDRDRAKVQFAKGLPGDRDRNESSHALRGDDHKAGSSRIEAHPQNRVEKPRGLEGRWERGVTMQGGRAPAGLGKREHSPAGDEQTQKRTRAEPGDGPRPASGRPPVFTDAGREGRGRGDSPRRAPVRENTRGPPLQPPPPPPSDRGAGRRSERRGPPRR